jgi:hypothetical protein
MKNSILNEDWLSTFLNDLSDCEIQLDDDRTDEIMLLLKPLLYSDNKRLAQSVLVFMCTVGAYLGVDVVEEVLNGEKEVRHRKLLKSLLSRL